jgi:hypothetical protein
VSELPTGPQRRYRADLIRVRDPNERARAVLAAASAPDAQAAGRDAWTLRTTDPHAFLNAAFALALPEPETMAEMRAQLDHLAPDRRVEPVHATGGSGPTGYAREHREWAAPILQRLAAAWGARFERVPALVSVADLRAVVAPQDGAP